jgi:hypothetical protein
MPCGRRMVGTRLGKAQRMPHMLFAPALITQAQGVLSSFRGLFLLMLCVITHTGVASAHMHARAYVGVAHVVGFCGWIWSYTCASLVSQ